MKRRYFTRRRHAIKTSLLMLRVMTWIAGPCLALWLGHKAITGGSLDLLAIGVISILAAIYLGSVLRFRGLSGQWTFF